MNIPKMDEEWKNINFPSFETLSPRVDPRTPNSLSRPFGSASATMLTLNTSQELHFLTKNPPHLQNPLASQICSRHSLPLHFLPNTNGKKRPPETDNSNSDTRHNRMIKNRDAAARSRARKQAYTDELELEVAYLLEENARLRKQQKQLLNDLKIRKLFGQNQPHFRVKKLGYIRAASLLLHCLQI